MVRAYEYMDVTGRIDCTDAQAVFAVASEVMQRHHPDLDRAPLQRAFDDVAALYLGDFPGYRACDMAYHDLPHILDVCLAMIRLIDGYQASHADGDQMRLGGELCVTGMLVALFHDSGYICKAGDHHAANGAEYTRVHVSRSAAFLRQYLPEVGYADYARLASRLVQFTGYEVDLSRFRFADPRHRRLGELIGTADILAQMSDRCYLDKCRDCLYPEFVQGGMTEVVDASGERVVRYADAVDLLKKTPDFIDTTLRDRLGTLFKDAWRYVEVHFGGSNPYFEAIEANRSELDAALADGSRRRLEREFSPLWKNYRPQR